MFDTTLTEDKLATYEIDLNAAASGEITESFLSMFGGALKEILRRMFGEVPDIDTIKQALKEGEDNAPQVVVKGTPCQIDSLAATLAAEKSYMEAYIQNDGDVTQKEVMDAKHRLFDEIQKFEDTTGIKWPFK